MLAKLIQSLFPEGQRKVMVSLIAILIGTGLDKFGGGLSDSMLHLLIAAVAIFTGGNVLTSLADVLKPLKGTKLGHLIEEFVPGDQGLDGDANAPQQTVAYAQAPPSNNVASKQEVYEAMNAAGSRFDTLEKQLAVQAQNVNQLVQIINQMRGATVARPPQPPVPAPSDR